MNARNQHRLLRYLIAGVWLIFGLICKVGNWSPSHEEIVARIMGEQLAPALTIAIGIAEVGMAIWVASGLWSRANAIIQIVLVGVMNTIEIIIAPDLLMWGRCNMVFAIVFMGVVYYHTFILEKRAELLRKQNRAHGLEAL